MALNDSAVFLPERCFIFYAPIGSALPDAGTLAVFNPDSPDTLAGAVTNEKQAVTVAGGPTGGTFTLTLSGQTTSNIAYNATAAAVKSALEALSTIGAGNVVVSLAASVYTVTFTGAKAGQNVPNMTAAASLTGGSSPTVTVANVTEGAPGSALSAWQHLGHTDLDEDIEGDEEGGDTEVRGTRQKPNLRTRDEPVTDFFTVNAVQFSPETLQLYYGGGIETAGKFTAPVSSTAQELAVLLVYIDGQRKLGELHRKCSVKRGGPISREAENFLRAPIWFTPLDPGVAQVGATEWLSVDLFD